MKTEAYEQLRTRMNTTPWKLWALIAKEHGKEFDYLIALDDWLYSATVNDQVSEEDFILQLRRFEDVYLRCKQKTFKHKRDDRTQEAA